MPYIALTFNDEVHVFDLQAVSLRQLPIDQGHWEVCADKFRTFCERYYVYVLNDPKRFEVPITGIRIFESTSDLISFLNGETASEFCRLKSSIKECDWPKPPQHIEAVSSIKRPTLKN